MVTKSDLTPDWPDWWSHFYGPVRNFGERVADFFSPNSEATTTDDGYDINIELPGVEEKDISVEVHNGQLTVTGEKRSQHEEKGTDYFFSERAYGRFERRFRLPEDADLDNIAAKQKDGVLNIRIAKSEPKTPKPKKIKIGNG